jgi:hypothetical protein
VAVTGGARRRDLKPRPEDAPEGAGRDAGGVPVEPLGDYRPLLADAATHGRRAKRRELDAGGLLGRQAAEQGISAGRVVQLYLSAISARWSSGPNRSGWIPRLAAGAAARCRLRWTIRRRRRRRT